MNGNKIATMIGGVFGLMLVAAVYLALMPLAIIWSLNTLFGFAIPFTFWTWLSALVLLGSIRFKLSSK
jgi:hypothetical protein